MRLAILMLVGLLQVQATLFPGTFQIVRTISFFVEPFEIVNSYGLFAVMTTTRPEIVLEGSDDGQRWIEYNFRFKPGELHRELPLIAPYQPRLDWQMWFAALGNYQQNAWVGTLAFRLLNNEPSVRALFGTMPFVRPPKYIRALLYEYNFTTKEERARSGVVWNRKLLGVWFKQVSLSPQDGSQ